MEGAKSQQTVVNECMEGDSHHSAYFTCPDHACTKTFAKASNLERHIQIGDHSYENATSGMDIALTVYAEQCETLKQYQDSTLHGIQQTHFGSGNGENEIQNSEVNNV
jgi:hypothetical protein